MATQVEGDWKNGAGVREVGAGLFVEFPVLGDVVTPLGGYAEFVEDRVDRAYRYAVGAVDAGGRVDVEHFFLIGGGDAVDGADFHAGGVFNPGTWFCDYIGHTGTAVAFSGFWPTTLGAKIPHDRTVVRYIFKSTIYFVKG